MSAGLRLALLAVVVLAGIRRADAEGVEQWTPASPLSRSMLDEQTLKKRWIAAEIPGIERARIVQARPAIRDRTNALTGQTRAAVAAVSSNAKGPTYQLDLGELAISTYAVQVVAMVPTEQLERWRRPLYLELAVDDQHGGGTTVYRQRVPYWDDFYAVTELYFNVDEKRHYTATLKVGDDSQVDAYIYSIALHDTLAGLVPRATKTKPGTYSDDEAARMRASSKRADVEQLVAKDVSLDAYALGGPELTPDQRRDRDDTLWNAVLPLNTQYLAEYDESWLANAMAPGDVPAADARQSYGAWELPAHTTMYAAWRSRFSLDNAKLDRTYSLDDLVAHRPLPDPYPFKDRGQGVYFPMVGHMQHPQHWMPIAEVVGWWAEGSRLALAPYHGLNFDRRLPYLYLATGNKHAARDAAFMLARWAYLYPGLTDDQILGYAVVAPGIPYDRDMRLRWRRFGYQRPVGLMLGLLYSYDQLFDYIKGNQELARAVGRYVPWVKTDEDLRRMIEMRLVQYAAKQVLRWQRWDDESTPKWLMLVAAIQQAPATTRPWLKELWRRTWVYPYSEAALPDLISTTTQRNGTTSIGSVSYTQAGSPFADLVELSHRYVANGGDPEFDLTDHRLYGKLGDAAAFPLEATIGGGFPLTIGDVGGVARGRITDQIQAFADNWRRGWTWNHDPRMAWIVSHYLGRTTETEQSWQSLTKAANAYGRNPFLALSSRVLANWAGILESGQESDDFRFKRSVYLRVGSGHGHNHDDTLDLQIQAHGVRLAGDLGERPDYSTPNTGDTLLHDRVEVDDKDNPRDGNWQGHSWIATFAALEGAQYMEGRAVPPLSHARTTKSYRRAVALIDAVADKAREPESYVFDVQRMEGGTWPTWCFHGPWAEWFEVNLDDRRPVGAFTQDKSADAAYLRKFLDGAALKYAGKVPANAPLVATWRLRRSEETLTVTSHATGEASTRLQRNAEKAMLGADYSATAPPKFLRTYLLGHAGEKVLVAQPTPEGPPHSVATWPFLFVGHDQSQVTSTVFAAIHEPFLGRAFISEVRALAIDGAKRDANDVVAVAVKTTSGHSDWLFSDGDPSVARRVDAVTIQAEFGYRSDDDRGLRVLELVAGRSYRNSELELVIDRAATEASIEAVDYARRRVSIRTDLPAELWVHQQVQIGNPEHQTSFSIVEAHREQGLVVLTLDGSMDLSYAKITAVDAAKSRVSTDIGPVDLDQTPGMSSGLTLTNDTASRDWKVKRYLGLQPNGAYVYELDGKVDARALPLGSQLRLWEIGRGDTVRMSSHVQLRRLDTGANAGRYELTANTAVTVRASGLPEVQITGRQLTSGKPLVRLK